mmetsp:Transcript_6112/g.13847  ORF Transcript_6112/g.13847 Transcript_6112/m.13847 type:complete len:193 (+) Transcript_6112:518-1096(+)
MVHNTPATAHGTRINLGQCSDCGLQTHESKSSLIRRTRTLIPLTNDGVFLGRCRLCNPITRTATTGKRFCCGNIQGNYVGELNANGLCCGSGQMMWEDGDVYDGEWKAGKHVGQGTLWYADGDRYEGEWKAGKHDGQGTYWFADGGRYEGEWKAGEEDGQGTYWYASGGRCEGKFKAGKQDGQGSYWYVECR